MFFTCRSNTPTSYTNARAIFRQEISNFFPATTEMAEHIVICDFFAFLLVYWNHLVHKMKLLENSLWISRSSWYNESYLCRSGSICISGFNGNCWKNFQNLCSKSEHSVLECETSSRAEQNPLQEKMLLKARMSIYKQEFEIYFSVDFWYLKPRSQLFCVLFDHHTII